jgi:hypothetical protein
MPPDSTVWVEHLRTGLPRLAALLLEGEVLIHPWVIGKSPAAISATAMR